MRADFAMLELFDFESTSDQQDFRLYPAICLPYAPGDLTELYPRRLEPWTAEAGPAGTALLRPAVTGLSARVYQVGRRPHD